MDASKTGWGEVAIDVVYDNRSIRRTFYVEEIGNRIYKVSDLVFLDTAFWVHLQCKIDKGTVSRLLTVWTMTVFGLQSFFIHFFLMCEELI